MNWVGRSSPGAESALYLYDCAAHLFAARHFQQTVERDLNWFEHVVDGAGHFVMQEKPDEVNALVLDFLAQLK